MTQYDNEMHILPVVGEHNWLNVVQRDSVMVRFPKQIYLAYDASKPDQLPAEYDLQLMVPKGRRFYLWASSEGWYLMEPGKQTTDIGSIYIHSTTTIPPNLMGSIVSGYMVDTSVVGNTSTIFLVDDIYQYANQGLYSNDGLRFTDDQKAPFLHKYMTTIGETVPCPFNMDGVFLVSMALTTQPLPPCGYPIKYVQYRATSDILPHYYGVDPRSAPSSAIMNISDNVRRIFYAFNQTGASRIANTKKPTYRNRCVFLVQACEMSDVYKLYCRQNKHGEQNNKHGEQNNKHGEQNNKHGEQNNKHGEQNNKHGEQLWFGNQWFEFYQYALVPDISTSVILNTLFSNVYANQNLDSIEESDDEDDEQKTSTGEIIPKNLDFERKLYMECGFDWTRKMWIPQSLTSQNNVPFGYDL
jgi:hypothetical protein